MKFTPNLNLKKPDLTDYVNIADINSNMDVIDAEIAKKVTTELDGRMSKEDKIKLDNIASGAQVNAVTSVAGKTGAVTLGKSDVNLGNIENYSIATQAEAEAGTSNVKYTTPLRVKQAINKAVVTGSYVGNGTYTRNITLGYKPKFIFVRDNNTHESDNPKAWISMEKHGVAFKNESLAQVGGTSSVMMIKPISNGIEVAHADGAYGYSSNESGMTYHYVAIV